jgi:hypothetical protein
MAYTWAKPDMHSSNGSAMLGLGIGTALIIIFTAPAILLLVTIGIAIISMLALTHLRHVESRHGNHQTHQGVKMNLQLFRRSAPNASDFVIVYALILIVATSLSVAPWFPSESITIGGKNPAHLFFPRITASHICSLTAQQGFPNSIRRNNLSRDLQISRLFE